MNKLFACIATLALLVGLSSSSESASQRDRRVNKIVGDSGANLTFATSGQTADSVQVAGAAAVFTLDVTDGFEIGGADFASLVTRVDNESANGGSATDAADTIIVKVAFSHDNKVFTSPIAIDSLIMAAADTNYFATDLFSTVDRTQLDTNARAFRYVRVQYVSGKEAAADTMYVSGTYQVHFPLQD